MKKRTSIIIGIIALILDQLTKVLFVNKNMELIPNVLKIYYWQNEGTIFEITNGIKISWIITLSTLTVTISPGFTALPVLCLIIFSMIVSPIISLLSVLVQTVQFAHGFYKSASLNNAHQILRQRSDRIFFAIIVYMLIHHDINCVAFFHIIMQIRLLDQKQTIVD